MNKSSLFVSFTLAGLLSGVGALVYNLRDPHTINGESNFANYHFCSQSEKAEFEQSAKLITEVKSNGSFIDTERFATKQSSKIDIPFHKEKLSLADLSPAWVPKTGVLKSGSFMSPEVQVRVGKTSNGTTITEIELSDTAGTKELAYIIANSHGYEIWYEGHPRRSRDWNVDLLEQNGDPTPN